MIPVTGGIAIDPAELEESFIRAAGPGGQNVNKVASAVQLRFNIRLSPSLSDDVKARMMRLAGSRLTREGEIVLVARRFRTQERNRADAVERLLELIRRAAVPPAVRRATRAPLAQKRKRREAKAQRSHVKTLRGTPRGED